MFERISKEIQIVLDEFRLVLEDIRNIAKSTLSAECQGDARREQLREAAEAGNALRLRLLLKTFAWNDEDVALALFAATSRRCAKVIAQERPAVFQATAPWAVRGALLVGDVATLRGLLDAGAAPDEPCGFRKETPLHLAAVCRNFNCAVELLLRGADPNARDAKGETPLHRAAEHGRGSVLWVLLVHGGASVDARCARGQTPLHRAAARGHACCAELLMEKGADVTARDHAGDSPLDAAAAYPALAHLLSGRRTLTPRSAPI